MENGTISLLLWWLKTDIFFFVDPVLYTFQWQRRNNRSVSSYSYFRQSAHCLRSSSGNVWRFGLGNFQMFEGYGETCSAWNLGKYKETCCVKTSKKIAILPEHLQLTKLCSTAGLAKAVEKYSTSRHWMTQNLTDWRTLRKDNSSLHLIVMHLTRWTYLEVSNHLKWKDGFVKHEDRSNSGCDGLLSSRTLWSWNHDRISIWRQNLLLGQNREWNQQIRDGEVGRDVRWKSIGEKSIEKPVAKARPQQTSNLTLSCVFSVPWTNVDRRGNQEHLIKNNLEISKLMIRLLRHDD